MPHDLANKLGSIIKSAEKQLGEFAGEASGQGQYALAKRAIDVAELLSRLGGGVSPGHQAAGPSSKKTTWAPSRARRSPKKKQVTRRSRAEQVGPATFRRDGSMLVKRSDSRQTGKTYEHKADHSLLAAITDVLAKWNTTRPLVAVNELIADAEQQQGPVPGYQAYLILGWMLSLGLVRKHGRSGYSVPEPQALKTAVATAWEDLISA